MKGDFLENLSKIRDWANDTPKFLSFLILIYGSNIVSEEYISKKMNLK